MLDEDETAALLRIFTTISTSSTTSGGENLLGRRGASFSCEEDEEEVDRIFSPQLTLLES